MHHLLQWAVAGTTFHLHLTAAALLCLLATGLLLPASVEPTQLLFALALPDVDALPHPFEGVVDRSAVRFPDHLAVGGRDRVHSALMDQGVVVEAGTLVAGNIATAEVARLARMLAKELQQVDQQEQQQQEVLLRVEGA